MGFGGETKSIKYYKTLGIYKNSTGNVVFDPKSMRATSYNWWLFVTKIKGKVVFNDYYYSNSTSSHQSCVREVMKQLKIKIDVTVYQRDSLSSGIDVRTSVYDRELNLFRAKRKGLKKTTIEKYLSIAAAEDRTIKYLRKKLNISVPRAMLLEVRKAVAESEARRLERARNMREGRAEISVELKQDQNNLGPIDLLSKMNETDDLKPILIK